VCRKRHLEKQIKLKMIKGPCFLAAWLEGPQKRYLAKLIIIGQKMYFTFALTRFARTFIKSFRLTSVNFFNLYSCIVLVNIQKPAMLAVEV
jgi:hypothetical protein